MTDDPVKVLLEAADMGEVQADVPHLEGPHLARALRILVEAMGKIQSGVVGRLWAQDRAREALAAAAEEVKRG